MLQKIHLSDGDLTGYQGRRSIESFLEFGRRGVTPCRGRSEPERAVRTKVDGKVYHGVWQPGGLDLRTCDADRRIEEAGTNIENFRGQAFQVYIAPQP